MTTSIHDPYRKVENAKEQARFEATLRRIIDARLSTQQSELVIVLTEHILLHWLRKEMMEGLRT